MEAQTNLHAQHTQVAVYDDLGGGDADIPARTAHSRRCNRGTHTNLHARYTQHSMNEEEALTCHGARARWSRCRVNKTNSRPPTE